MKSLHKILVPLGTKWGKKYTKEELIEKACLIARDTLEEYKFYDGFSEDIGELFEKYPYGVILGAFDKDRLIAELTDIQHQQEEKAYQNVDLLVKITGETDLRSIVRKILEQYNVNLNMTTFHLMDLADILDGNYRFGSCYLDAENCTTRIWDERLEEIKQYAEDYALVLFNLFAYPKI